ncbi:MAG: SMP-30/gluconolactonase/LRE family protein [Hyphomicrobiales bacterium]|nr:SMP-30/gluconolactonase/LRE family protein [Hyphomicrobiales bacterium]
MRPQIVCLTSFANDLGESLHWDAGRGRLLWIDAWAGLVFAYDPATGAIQRTDFAAALGGRPIGSIASSDTEALIGGVRGGFYRLDMATGDARLLAPVEADRPASNRLNDGKCDGAGRFWCVSINTDHRTPSGALWRFARNQNPRLMEDGIIAGNGIAWSPDKRSMYLADSFRAEIWKYDFDLEQGEIADRRLFAQTPAPGLPDGATVDADGCYWTALFRGGAVAQFDPDGKLMNSIALPVANPTMCNFGGADLDILYVTSASRFSDAAQPQAGHLFAIEGLGVRGLADAKFQM